MPEIQILLVEDSLQDVEMTLDVLQGENLANQIHVARDGAEALDFLFCRDIFAERAGGAPKMVLLDLRLKMVPNLATVRSRL